MSMLEYQLNRVEGRQRRLFDPENVLDAEFRAFYLDHPEAPVAPGLSFQECVVSLLLSQQENEQCA